MFARLPHLPFRMRCALFSMLHRSLSDLPHSALYLFHPVPPPFVKRFSHCSARCLEAPRRWTAQHYRLVCLDQLRVFALCEPFVGFGCAILNHLPCPRHDCRSYPATRLAISRVSLNTHQSRQPGHERVIDLFRSVILSMKTIFGSVLQGNLAVARPPRMAELTSSRTARIRFAASAPRSLRLSTLYSRSLPGQANLGDSVC